MSFATLLVLAFGLSMDAFAVAVCKGLAMKKLSLKNMLIVGAYFGAFQAGMPLLGYLLGSAFESLVTAIDHWIAFVLLCAIGANMIRESFHQGGDEELNASVSFRIMVVLAIATSIDALAVGVTFAFLQVNIVYAVLFIGVITFLLSMLGVKIGHVFGVKYKSRAELAGGVVLIVLGVKILLEHLGIINF